MKTSRREFRAVFIFVLPLGLLFLRFLMMGFYGDRGNQLGYSYLDLSNIK